jgi:hypothetical protein
MRAQTIPTVSDRSGRRTSPLMVAAALLFFTAVAAVVWVAGSARRAPGVTKMVEASEEAAAPATRSTPRSTYESNGAAPAVEAAPAIVPPAPHPELLQERPVTAKEEREKQEQRLATPARDQKWRDPAERSLKAVQDAFTAAAMPGVTVSGIKCLAGGCEAELHYAPGANLQDSDGLLLRNEAFGTFPGSKFRTAPEFLADGSSTSALMVFAPETNP